MFSNDLRQLGASRIQYYSLTSQSQHPVSRRTVRSFARSFIRRRQEWWCEQRRNETVSTRAHNLTGSSRATSILLWPLCLFVDGRIEMGTYIIDRLVGTCARWISTFPKYKSWFFFISLVYPSNHQQVNTYHDLPKIIRTVCCYMFPWLTSFSAAVADSRRLHPHPSVCDDCSSQKTSHTSFSMAVMQCTESYDHWLDAESKPNLLLYWQKQWPPALNFCFKSMAVQEK